MVINKNNSKAFLLTIFIIIIILSLLTIKSYLSAIITSMLLTLFFYPVYRLINSKIKRKTLSAAITTLLIIIIIFLPLALILNELFSESVKFYKSIKGLNISQEKIQEVIFEYIGFDINVKENLNKISNAILNYISKFIFSIPDKIFQVILIFLSMFYFFRDGENLIIKIKTVLPLKEDLKEHIFKELKNVTRAVLYGYFITALIQGAFGTIGFLIFGIHNPLFWGVVMALLSLIPLAGPWLVYIPAGYFLIQAGNELKGTLLIIYGLIFISTLDNFIRPKIIGAKTNVHPLIILFGLIGGIASFGLIGLIIGPVILSFLIIAINVYLQEKNDTKS